MASIMLVDDAMFMRAALRRMVEEGGHTVVSEASNGKQAIEQDGVVDIFAKTGQRKRVV